MIDQDKFNKAVINWISEATSLLQYRSAGGRRILADACGECWSAFEATNHDAAPAARAKSCEVNLLQAASELGNPVRQLTQDGTGNKQTAPPCVETDGPPSKGEGLHVPDSRTRLSEAEIDALEYVVEEGRIASMDDYGVLRSLLCRMRPEREAAESAADFIDENSCGSSATLRNLLERLK